VHGPLGQKLALSLCWVYKEGIINSDAQGGDKAICLRSHAYNGNQFSVFLVSHAFARALEV
jgi:hypothetical protein